jgi:hypothetical protein
LDWKWSGLDWIGLEEKSKKKEEDLQRRRRGGNGRTSGGMKKKVKRGGFACVCRALDTVDVCGIVLVYR